jgi:two-component system, cell cycle sensor histidine kinase and response regulator CckA
MPRIDGIEVYEALKKHEPPIRFLLVSGYAPEQLRNAGEQSSIPPFLQKPWSLSALTRRIREVLDDA